MEKEKILIKSTEYFKFRGINDSMPDWFMDILKKFHNLVCVSQKAINIGTNEIPFHSYVVKRGDNISILTKEEFEKEYKVADKSRSLYSPCEKIIKSEDEVIIKSSGPFTQIFINGVELKWVQKIKFEHNVNEFPVLEIKKII